MAGEVVVCSECGHPSDVHGVEGCEANPWFLYGTGLCPCPLHPSDILPMTPGSCGDPECPVLHDDPANPIHPPWYVDSRAQGERQVRVRPMFAWYDLWVGVFIDRAKRRVYVFPLPCLGVVVSW